VDVFVDDKILKQPLHWKKPRRVFVCSQTDLFGEWNSDELIDRVFAVMALCPQHQFQVLSKRPERMLEYIGAEASDWIGRAVAIKTVASWIPGYARLCEKADFMPIPYRNIWLGISCEDQTTADERATILRQVPAAIRFISQEPQLDNIEWTPESLAGISWLVQGGESGPGSRPFYLKWARSTMDQCKAAGVSYFLKQLGAKPIDTDPKHWQHRMRIGDGNAEYNRYIRVPLRDRKGGDMSEWPEDLRVRQFPA
jgi:protein gp37